MAQEIELKLALPVHLAPQLRQHPALAGVTSRKRCVRNIYLDTPDQLLRQQRIAVRRRQIGDQWLLTVKTANTSSNGLSRRLEWEYPMPPEQLNFDVINDSNIRQLLEQHGTQLTLAFRTDFVRTTWRLHHEGSHIEIALDLGYIRTQQHKEAIHELELELLDGQESALASLARTLQQTLPLPPLAPSKAARGYALLDQSL